MVPGRTRIAFMGGDSAAEYDIWVVDVDGTNLVQLTDSPGSEGWPAWTTARTRMPRTARTTGDIGPHHDVWVLNAGGSGLARVTPEFGRFVTWSPNGEYLLIPGYDLYVIRPDGTGRASLDVAGVSGGLFPDWIGRSITWGRLSGCSARS